MPQFEFQFVKTVVVEVDDDLIDALPDFQETITASVTDLEGLAHHVAWNWGAMRFNDVDGLVGHESKYRIISSDWDDPE